MTAELNVILQYTQCTCSQCLLKGPNGAPQKIQTMRVHMRTDTRRALHLIFTPPLATTSSASPQSLSLPPDLSGQQLDLELPSSQSDQAHDYFTFEPDSDFDASQDANCALSDYLWPATDSDSESQSRLGFSSDSDNDEDSSIFVDPPDDSDDQENGLQEDSLSSEVYTKDITSDPLFRTRASLFDAFQPEQEDPADETDIPWASDDHPAIRNAYIRAFVGAAFEGMTRSAVANMLEGYRVVFLSAKASVCWKPHFPAELAHLESPGCQQPECPGLLYEKKRCSNGAEKRTPLLTVPFVPPERAIQRMCLQPGKVAQWQEWRGPGDGAGRREPSTLKGFDAFPDPDKPMTDITDGWGWRAIQAGLERRRNGVWEIRDVDVQNLKQQFVALPNGLVVQINIDCFKQSKAAVIRPVPCMQQFATHLDVSDVSYNHIMEIVVRHFKRLYNGVFLKVHGKDDPEPFHVQIGSDASDLPASRKTSGLLSYTSKFFMCDHCDTPFYSLVHPDAFDSTKIVEHDPWWYLKYAFRSRDASAEVAEEISRRRGVRYSPMDNLVNWLPGNTGLFDLMHAIFGTTIKHLCKNILYKNGMISTEGTVKIEAFFKRLVWPPSTSRLPPSVARGAGSIKADQWRSQITVFFVGLFDAWQVDGEIPDIDAEPSAPNTKNAAAQAAQEKLVRARMREHLLAKNPDAPEEELDAIKNVTMDHSLRKHYETVVQFTAAVQIITLNSISPNEVRRGCSALERSVQSWAAMNCHLHGPAPGWWTYPYERNNGFLGRFNHNGHSGGEMEGTMMRGWWKTTLIQDLISRLESIKDPAPEDIDSLKVLKSYLKGGTSEQKDAIQFPLFSQELVLRTLGPGYYKLVFDYLKSLWAARVKLVSDVELVESNTQHSFLGHVQSFSHIWIHRRRHGAGSQHRGKSAQYAYIDSRVPVKIERIFRAQENISDGSKLIAEATDIGVRAWRAELLAPLEVIKLEQLTGHFPNPGAEGILCHSRDPGPSLRAV
ncbi:hypothetical protein B0H19DRAFT_1293882 [Mycena capillaripes]|nr:hypothetical protein B0H19DRAFT_1293882 [Mycena capillaripes]